MKQCSVCNSIVDNYLPIEEKYIQNAKESSMNAGHIVKSETLNKEEYECPKCYALDRDRLVVLFLKKLFKSLLQEQNKVCKLRILDIAPSAPVGKWIKANIGFCEYITADLFMENVDYKIDIQDMSPFSSESFDIVICCHVLEHIRDDVKGMSEICRVLKKDGIAILLVPLDLNQKTIDEEYDLSEEENIKRFGQADHVRKYSKKGFLERLSCAGFHVHQYKKSLLIGHEWKRNSLTNTSTLYLGTKRTGNVFKMFWKDREVVSFKMVDDFLNGTPKNAGGEYQYYIDSLKLENDMLSLWGWFYFEKKRSQTSKLKLIVKKDSVVSIREFDWRIRNDIEETFNVNHDGNLLCSGIDIQMDTSLIERGKYNLELLIINENEYVVVSLDSIILS